MGRHVDLNNVEAIILGPESLVRAYEAELSSLPALKVIVGLSADVNGRDGNASGVDVHSSDYLDPHSTNHSHTHSANHSHTPITDITESTNVTPNSGTITFRGLFLPHDPS